jgi:1-acyl-sn-glycerol-3-phosphate acyltransferase
MLYRLIKIMMRTALRLFYRQVIGRKLSQIPAAGPALLVANHPSSLMDAALIGILLQRPVHFFARGDLFANRFVSRILNALHMHPVHHHEAGRQTLGANDDAFEKASSLLASGELVLFFPEGLSHTDYHLMAFRKGAFRIALKTAADHPGIQLPIVPIGINYSHPTRLFSRAWVNAGAPIPTEQFSSLYRINPAQAVRLLANTAWLGVKALVVESPKHHSAQLSMACEMIRSDYPWNQYVPEQIIDREIELGKNCAEWKPELQSVLDEYAGRLHHIGLRDEHVVAAQAGKLSGLPVILGFPAAFIGWVLNALPLLLGKVIADKKVSRTDFYSWVLVSVSAILYIIWMFILIAMAVVFLPAWKSIAFIFITIATGQYCWNYLAYFSQWQIQKQGLSIDTQTLSSLSDDRENILREITISHS